MSFENASETTSANITRVAVKPPPFWKPNPTLWFAQLEAQFSIAGITADSTKFYHVISAVESDILNSVSDLILKPPAEKKYEALKQRLIDLHSESQESKIRTLLQGLELGDQRPSQLLTRMRALAGETVGEPLLKSLWLSRLPPHTQSILAALNETLPQLAGIADKISGITSTPSINFATAQTPRQSDSLEQQVAELIQQVNKLTTTMQRRERSKDRENNFRNSGERRSSSRGRYFRQYKEPDNGLCFYHTNFGSRAKKCASPCSFHNQGN